MYDWINANCFQKFNCPAHAILSLETDQEFIKRSVGIDAQKPAQKYVGII